MPFTSFCSKFIEENQKSIVILLLMITIIGGIVGFRYYKHTKEDPEFCMSCHMMQDAFKTWEKSKHRDFTCQKCHIMNILEQNKMLISYVVKGQGTTSQQHGRISPWDACRTCHLSDVSQGSVTLSSSYGHAKHVFMQKINCSKCHTGSLHTFAPNIQACSECHKDKAIHGLGMEGMSCLQCHSYSEKSPKMISTGRCRSCHKDIPEKGIMSTLKCFDCHHPHGRIKPTSQDCLKTCHGNEAKVGQHNLHMTKTKLQCLDCHKAHTWAVGKKEAVKRCTTCHKLKDPATFIY
ncbi:MAG: NapC/NirT family cytochrome c [Thermodesulfovibrionales bacterium]